MKKNKPNLTAERLAQLREEDQALRPQLEAEIPGIRAAWREYVQTAASVMSRHSDEIDEYIRTHGPMTRTEVVERALEKLLADG